MLSASYLFDTALKYIHDVIKKAYRNLAKEYHPYKSKGNEVKFIEIADAYKTLSHPNKKARFDQARNNPFGQGFGGDFGRFWDLGLRRR